MTRSPLFPSDLEGRAAARDEIRVAGRVLEQKSHGVRIADAFALISVEGPGLAGVRLGDLVVLVGAWNGRALVDAHLESRQAAPVPRGDGELGRFIFDGVGPRLRERSRALSRIRAFFSDAGFIEVETPLRVPAPGVDAHIQAIRARPGWLITSPELEMKRLVVAGVPRQFQIARASREDETGALHEPEFTLLEWYRAFAGFEEVMSDTEALIEAVARALRGRPELVAPDGRTIRLDAPFERVSVAEAFRRYAGVADASDLSEADPRRFFELLSERVEPGLGGLDRPVFLTDYPISQAALARPSPGDPRVAERFELYVAGIELSNGYGELTDPVLQRARFRSERARRKRSGESVYPLNERFLSALEEGMPPASGNALGVDRLLMLVLGRSRIQDVIAFPSSGL